MALYISSLALYNLTLALYKSSQALYNSSLVLYTSCLALTMRGGTGSDVAIPTRVEFDHPARGS